MSISFDDFLKVDMRVGKITEVMDFPEARKAAYILHVDLGDEIGIKKTSAQITANYTKEDLMNKKVVCVVNFPPRQIGPVMSEVLVLGVPDENGEVILLAPEKNTTPPGGRVY